MIEWWYDMRQLQAARDDLPDDGRVAYLPGRDGGGDYPPPGGEPPWVRLAGVLVMLAAFAVLVAVVVGSMRAVT